MDRGVLAQTLRGVSKHNLTGLKHITPAGDLERHEGVLLDKKDGHPFVAVDAGNDVEDVPFLTPL